MYLHILLIGITVYYPVDRNAFCLVTITVGLKPSIRVTHKEVLVAPTSLISFLTILKLHMMTSLHYSNMLMIRQFSVALVNEFLNWLRDNCMSCNPSKCKELVIRKKSKKNTYNPVNCIPQHNELCLLGVTLQSDCKFSCHVKVKLAKANKGLHILRTLRKGQYNENEIDLLFKIIVLSNLTYGLSVYGAYERDLNTVQNFHGRSQDFSKGGVTLCQTEGTRVFAT